MPAYVVQQCPTFNVQKLTKSLSILFASAFSACPLIPQAMLGLSAEPLN